MTIGQNVERTRKIIAEELRHGFGLLSRGFIDTIASGDLLNRFFTARIDRPGESLFDVDVRKLWGDKLSNVYNDVPYEYINIAYRFAISYGHIIVRTVYPDWAGMGYRDGQHLGIALCRGGEGIEFAGVQLSLIKMGGANKLLLHLGNEGVYTNMYANRVNVSFALPSDYTTAAHFYWIKHNRSQAWFGVDNRLIAVALFTRSGVERILYENSPPYTIYIAPFSMPSDLYPFLALEPNLDAKGNIVPTTVDLSWRRVRITSGDPQPPLALPLYVAGTNTLMAGQSISSGSLTSHPIPVFGYDKSAVYFMSDQAGTLELQIFTLSGNWRTYDTVSVSANALVKYTITGGALVARVVFTPSTYPATILEGMAVMLSGD
jgi:hypothetical protein